MSGEVEGATKLLYFPPRVGCRGQLRRVRDEDLDFQWEWIRHPINFISILLLGEKIKLELYLTFVCPAV